MASALLSHRPSPTASPSLLPASMSVPSPSRSPLPIFPASASPRTYARAPPARPYALSPRNSQRALDVDGDTKAFADSVVGIIEDRARKIRSGGFAQDSDVEDEGRQQARKGRSLGGSIAGSWEIERAEFIVDVPVWSPGCFQGKSTPLSIVGLILIVRLVDVTRIERYDIVSYPLVIGLPHEHPFCSCVLSTPPPKRNQRTSEG